MTLKLKVIRPGYGDVIEIMIIVFYYTVQLITLCYYFCKLHNIMRKRHRYEYERTRFQFISIFINLFLSLLICWFFWDLEDILKLMLSKYSTETNYNPQESFEEPGYWCNDENDSHKAMFMSITIFIHLFGQFLSIQHVLVSLTILKFKSTKDIL